MLVEADPSYLIEYRTERARDAYLSAAVVPERMRAKGTVTFHIMHDPGWSTASAEHLAIAGQLGKGSPKSTITVPCLTINELLENYDDGNELDFISIDIEGLDKEVLIELDTERFDPKVVVAENSAGCRSNGTLWRRRATRCTRSLTSTPYTSGARTFACKNRFSAKTRKDCL